MLFFDSQGCAYCKAFVDHTLADPRLQTKTCEGFDAIGLDMFSVVEITDFSGQRSTVKEFAIREGATMSPTVVFYGTDGTPLLRTVGYYPPERFRLVLDYLIGGHHKTRTLREYAAKQSPQRSSQTDETGKETPLEKGSYAFDRSRMPSQRPLLILFEGKHCQECLQLRSQVLSYPPVRQQLARFDAARLDWSDDTRHWLRRQAPGQTPPPGPSS
jgi:thioredoxin-related protein